MLGLCAGDGRLADSGDEPAVVSRAASPVDATGRAQPQPLTAAPNFAFELAAARTSDEEMAGLDLGHVLHILSGAERVSEATLTRFTQRFARFNLNPAVVRPAYGLAEAVLYVAAHPPGPPTEFVHFEPDELAAGRAVRCRDGTPLVSYGVPGSPSVRIVDPDTAAELPPDTVGRSGCAETT